MISEKCDSEPSKIKSVKILGDAVEKVGNIYSLNETDPILSDEIVISASEDVSEIDSKLAPEIDDKLTLEIAPQIDSKMAPEIAPEIDDKLASEIFAEMRSEITERVCGGHDYEKDLKYCDEIFLLSKNELLTVFLLTNLGKLREKGSGQKPFKIFDDALIKVSKIYSQNEINTTLKEALKIANEDLEHKARELDKAEIEAAKEAKRIKKQKRKDNAIQFHYPKGSQSKAKR